MRTRGIVTLLLLLVGGVVLATTVPSLVGRGNAPAVSSFAADDPALRPGEMPAAAGNPDANRAETQADLTTARTTGAPPARALDPLPNSETKLTEPGPTGTSAGNVLERGTAPGDGTSGGRATTKAVPAPSYREVTVPAGTPLRLRLENAVASDRSKVEDAVRARLANPVVIGGRTVIPAGSTAVGHVTDARRAGRVKGRATLAMRFSSLTPANDDERYDIRTNTWARQARATKKKDAAKIGIPAGAGAVVGGIIGGKKGALIGAGVGGGAGTGVVLSTRGEEVRLNPGATIVVRLSSPITIRLRE